MIGLSCVRSWQCYAVGVLLLGALLGGCVSKACPDGQKFKNGKCLATDSSHVRGETDAGSKQRGDASADANVDAGAVDATVADAAQHCGAQPVECWQDADHDGFAPSAAASMNACQAKCPAGWVPREPTGGDVDCNDRDAQVYPRRCWRDSDTDGYATDSHDQSTVCGKSCGAGWTSTEPKGDAVDCDDHALLINPGAPEICNSQDEDCDGIADESSDDSCSAVIPHGTGFCFQGGCRLGKCNAGFADCDADGTNGCEQKLNTADSCGACGSTCDPWAKCAATKTKYLGQCACQAPSFGDGIDCHGPGPIAAGSLWTCVIDVHDRASCVGVQGALVTQLPAKTQYRQLALGQEFGVGCGITLDGHLDCWTHPDIVAGESDTKFIQVVVGEEFLCGLTVDHRALCWGHTKGARFGEATPPDESFVQLAAGYYHACGLRADGTAICWGAGSAGRTINCLDGSTASNPYDCGQARPPQDKFMQITAGRYHTCGLKQDGGVVCWGIGVNSGPAKQTYDYKQAIPTTDKLMWISAGQYHTCGLRKADGTAVCWGAGQMGGTADYDSLQSVPPSESFLMLSAGWVHTCGLTTQNHMVCWGSNSNGKAPPYDLGPYLVNPGL